MEFRGILPTTCRAALLVIGVSGSGSCCDRDVDEVTLEASARGVSPDPQGVLTIPVGDSLLVSAYGAALGQGLMGDVCATYLSDQYFDRFVFTSSNKSVADYELPAAKPSVLGIVLRGIAPGQTVLAAVMDGVASNEIRVAVVPRVVERSSVESRNRAP
jgi:hypothetical protein